MDGVVCRRLSPGLDPALVRILAVPLAGCVTQGKLLTLSVPPWLCLCNGDGGGGNAASWGGREASLSSVPGQDFTVGHLLVIVSQ